MLFRSMVIADRLAIYVNKMCDDIDGSNDATLAIATCFFAFQIYCDFSGYSDIAIGTARMLVIRLMQNFRLPYLPTGLSDFWSRWHIPLTIWFRDCVCIPLGVSPNIQFLDLNRDNEENYRIMYDGIQVNN